MKYLSLLATVIISLLLAIGCSIQRPADLSMQYNNNSNRGLDKVIDIDGYYIIQRECDSTFFEAFMFYPDGLFCIFTGTDLSDAVACFENDEASTLCKNILWGLYQIETDTIQTQVLRQEGLEYYAIHRNFLISQNKNLIHISEYVNARNTKIGYLKNYPSFYENRCPTQATFFPITRAKRKTTLCPLFKNPWF